MRGELTPGVNRRRRRRRVAWRRRGARGGTANFVGEIRRRRSMSPAESRRVGGAEHGGEQRGVEVDGGRPERGPRRRGRGARASANCGDAMWLGGGIPAAGNGLDGGGGGRRRVEWRRRGTESGRCGGASSSRARLWRRRLEAREMAQELGPKGKRRRRESSRP